MRGPADGCNHDFMRHFLVTTIAVVLGGTLVATPHAPATADPAAPRTCAGLTVTVDLRDPGAPNPNRPASDVVIGTRHGQSISTGAGDDVICARPGNDIVSPGPGDDIVIGGQGTDLVAFLGAPRAITVDLRLTGPQTTGWGDDTLRDVEDVFGVEDFPNHLLGNSRDNDLIGGVASDDIRGNGGDDGLSPGLGAQADDELRGGAGDDEIFGGGGDDLLFGGPGDDYLCGGAHSDALYGGPGKDRLGACRGVAGEREYLYGGPGNDRLTAQDSDDLVSGGDGFDVVDFSSFDPPLRTRLTVDLAIVGPQDTSFSGMDTFTGVEGLVGTPDDDVLRGDDGPNYLYGGRGADTVDGRGGTDDCVEDSEDVFTGCENLVDPPNRLSP